MLCGLDKEGKGCVYGYDAIGSYDKLTYGVQGSGNEMGCTVMDNQFMGHNFVNKILPTDQTACEETAKDIINSIAERDIYTGDNVELVIIDKSGITRKVEKIRGD